MTNIGNGFDKWEAHDRERCLGGVSGNGKKEYNKQYNIVKRWSNLGPTSRFEIDSTLILSQLVISNKISRSG